MVPAGRLPSDWVALKEDEAAGAPNREVGPEEEAVEVEVEKEKVEGDERAELSTFWPKLKVTPAGAEEEDEEEELFSSVELLQKENRAGGGAEEEEVVVEDLLTSPPPVPYWRSMLLRWRS